MYLRIWQYEAAPGRVDEFVAAYGPAGDWARLFAGSPGFLGTELFRNEHAPACFVTVDRWREQSQWAAFLQEHRAAYDALDTALAPLTTVDSPLYEGTPAR